MGQQVQEQLLVVDRRGRAGRDRRAGRITVLRHEGPPRQAVVQELHGQVDHVAGAVAHHQPSRGGERADVAQLHLPARAEIRQRRDLRRGHGQHHALLGLRQPDLPRRQARVLERHRRQIHLGPQLGSHLPHRRGQPAGAAVGDGVVQTTIPGPLDHLDAALLDDRVADLHRRAGPVHDRGVQPGRGERGAPDAVAAGPAADDDDPVTGPGGGGDANPWEAARVPRRTPAGSRRSRGRTARRR